MLVKKKNDGVVRVKVNLQTKCTVTVAVADASVFIITFILRKPCQAIFM